MKNILLLENEIQAKLIGKDNNFSQIVSLTPFASFVLEERGFNYKIIDDYYDPKELYRLGVENYQKVERICSLIDRYVQEAYPSLSEIDFKPSWYNFFSLKTMYDTLSIRTFQLGKLIEHENPDMITVYEEMDTRYIGDKDRPLLFVNNELIYSKLLRLPGWDPVISFLPGVPLPEYPMNEYARKRTRLLAVLYKLVGSRGLVLLKKRYNRCFVYLMSALSPKKYTYVLGGGCDWQDSDVYLKERGIYCLGIPKDLMREIVSLYTQNIRGIANKDLADCLAKIQENEELKDLFKHGNIDFSPLLRGRFEFLVEHIVPRLYEIYKRALTIIKRKNIKAVIVPCKDTGPVQALAKAAHDSSIPVITWQHGGYGYHEGYMVPYFDLMGSDFCFVFGNGVAKTLTEPAKRFNTKVMSVGSASLELNHKNLNKQSVVKKGPAKVVLYPLGRYSQNHLYVSNDPVLSDNMNLLFQEEILKVLGRHEDYRVIVKRHPVYMTPPLQKYSKGKGFKNIEFLKYRSSVTDLLPSADIVVVDMPTTSLFHALTTQKPIFVYTGCHFLSEEAMRMIKLRAYCYDSLVEFTNVLDRFLSGEDIVEKVDLKNEEFLKTYGIHEGNCGEKAADLLDDIIHNFNRSGK